jgi:23S rRNA pseudouridine2605 synthase
MAKRNSSAPGRNRRGSSNRSDDNKRSDRPIKSDKPYKKSSSSGFSKGPSSSSGRSSSSSRGTSSSRGSSSSRSSFGSKPRYGSDDSKSSFPGKRKRSGEDSDDSGSRKFSGERKSSRFSSNTDNKRSERGTSRSEGNFRSKAKSFDKDSPRGRREGEGRKEEGGFKSKSRSFDKDSRSSSPKGRYGDKGNFSKGSRDGERGKEEGGFKSKSRSYDKDSRSSSPKGRYADKGNFSKGSRDGERGKEEGGFKPRSRSYDKDSASPKGRFGDKDNFSKGKRDDSNTERRSSSKPRSFSKESPRSGKFAREDSDRGSKKNFGKLDSSDQYTVSAPAQTEKIRLNRFIANSGVCSRREADELITMGLISVNGKTITELGYKVNPGDEVRYESRVLKAEKPVYVLLNKPKGYLTTTVDPQERNTVMHLIGNHIKERVYPVGRLDRNTTGLLLLTNDGDLADKLMHPSYNVKKIYKVELDRPLTKADYQRILDGVQLEEGKAMVDDLAIVSEDGKTVGVELHIGWNRVVRRIFESLEYDVVKLDRSVYAGLDKKDLPRGNWRFLTKEEIVRLKHYK